jgi:hypothetical protein
MEHWDNQTCRVWAELGLGPTLLMSACAVATSVMLTLGLHLV